jgi:hypothetical protein
MARAKKKPRIKDSPCIGPARNLTVLEDSISSSVDVDSVEKASLDLVSCGLFSCGHSNAHRCVGPAINFTFLEGSISCSVQFDSVKKVSLNSVSCGLVSCCCSDTISTHIAHCCRLKAEVKYKRNLLARIKRKLNRRDCVIHQSDNITNDGLLH